MRTQISSFISEYWDWLKNKTVLQEIDDWVEVTTPYLDRHNDYLQVYIKQESSQIVITDDGYVINDLRLSGCEFDTPRRKALLSIATQGYGVQVEKEALIVHATRESFPLKKHNLIQAMLAVNDLFYVASTSVVSMFNEDVEKWLNQAEIRYTPSVTFKGKSGYDQFFDFVVPASKQAPERIIKTVNRPTKDKAQNLVFAWIDIKEVRKPDSRAYAVLNDTDYPISPGILDALHKYDIEPLKWSLREEMQAELVK